MSARSIEVHAEVLGVFGVDLGPRWAAALEYAALGYEVLPLEGKRPARLLGRKGGVYHATSDPAVITGWWWRGDWNLGLRVPAGMIVLDVDVRNGGDETLAAFEERHGALPRTMTARSGSDDGSEHLFYLADETRLAAPGRGIDLKKRNGYVVAAPSIHPDSRAPYRWEDRRPPVALPEWCYAAFGPAPVVEAAAPPRAAGRRELTARGRALLDGEIEKSWGRDRGDSGVFWSCLFFAIAAGWSDGEIVRGALVEKRPGLYREVVKKGKPYLYAQLKYARAQALAAPLVEGLAEVEAGIAARDWKGRATARLLAETLAETAWAARSLTVRMSVYQMMSALSVTKNTARSARDYLVREGLLTVAAGPDRQGGAAYTLVVPAGLALAPAASPTRLDRAHDLFARGAGLGPTGLLVLRALADRPGASRKDLAAAAGVSLATVYRVIGKALAAGVVAESGKALSYLGDLDGGAARLGSVGRKAAVAALVARLRAEQAARLADLRATRQAAAEALWAAAELTESAVEAEIDRCEAAGLWVLDDGTIVDPLTGERSGSVFDAVLSAARI